MFFRHRSVRSESAGGYPCRPIREEAERDSVVINRWSGRKCCFVHGSLGGQMDRLPSQHPLSEKGPNIN